MKKTTASLCLLISLASAPALAERNPADPYEGYNRTVSKFNDKADKYVLSPVARGYRKVTPKPVRTGVINFFNNLRDVVSSAAMFCALTSNAPAKTSSASASTPPSALAV